MKIYKQLDQNILGFTRNIKYFTILYLNYLYKSNKLRINPFSNEVKIIGVYWSDWSPLNGEKFLVGSCRLIKNENLINPNLSTNCSFNLNYMKKILSQLYLMN